MLLVLVNNADRINKICRMNEEKGIVEREKGKRMARMKKKMKKVKDEETSR